MKRELKIGDSQIITIENRTVTVPHKVRMNIAEIANLFDIFYQTAKRNIRTIEKSGIVGGDNSMGGSVEGMKVYPDYYGLEMIIALSFQIKSRNAEVFRDWLLKKAAKTEMSKMLIMSIQNSTLN